MNKISPRPYYAGTSLGFVDTGIRHQGGRVAVYGAQLLEQMAGRSGSTPGPAADRAAAAALSLPSQPAAPCGGQVSAPLATAATGRPGLERYSAMASARNEASP
ncbi:hypothetical protein [Streptomyces sp. NPDC057889]|uniref:hypothetical protein n=1 Tax=unclassified Streptomyces TaxID=2593676 RepID=UPI0036A09C9A